MKISTSSYFTRMMLINAGAALLLGMSYDISYQSDLASSALPDIALAGSSALPGVALAGTGAASTETASEVAPIISHALDQVQSANKSGGFFSWFNNASSKNCEDCAKQVAEMRYGQCSSTDRNGYLEKQLNETAQQNTVLGTLIRSPIRPNSIIKPACMQASMLMGASSLPRSAFKTCNGNVYGSSVGPACVSENYFKLVNNSFDLVSTCMKDFIADGESEEMKKLDVRAVYALVNVESGFHINAVSGTGAGGIGQFTTAAITDVNTNQLNAVRHSLEANSMPACGRMSMEFMDSFQPIRNSSKNSCDRISIKNGNPVKNMIYTFAYLRGVKKDLDKQVFENKNYKSKFRMSEYDLARVKRALMVWAHNTGTAGTLTPAKALLNSLYRSKPVTNAETFINQLQQYMQKFPASANRTAARRKETSSYFPSITNRLHEIESKAGDDSCVN